MFVINEDQSIYITRGDIGVIRVSVNKGAEDKYIFQVGEVVRFNVFKKSECSCVVLQKDIAVEEESTAVEIPLYKEDTKIGEIINRPKEYWYEVELNPETNPQTIIGYDTKGAKIFKIFPEGEEAVG